MQPTLLWAFASESLSWALSGGQRVFHPKRDLTGGHRGLWTHEVIPLMMYGLEKSRVNDLPQDPGVKHSNFIIQPVMD